MNSSSKDKGGGLLGLMIKTKKTLPSSEPDGDEEDAGTGHEAAFESFADATNIPPEKREAAQEALHQYVKACMGGDYGGE